MDIFEIFLTDESICQYNITKLVVKKFVSPFVIWRLSFSLKKIIRQIINKQGND